MKIDFSGVEVFLDYLRGHGSLQEALRHPAYRTVFHHAEHFGTILTEKDVTEGLAGHDTPFYGLSNVERNMPAIMELFKYVKARSEEWSAVADGELKRIIPDADTDSITAYPIIGYDAGIGIRGVICMSLNCTLYHRYPDEFLSTLIHEGFHVLYERIHGLSRLDALTTPAAWRDFFLAMMQNEGLAVFAPLRMRKERQFPLHEDHPMLIDYALFHSPAGMEQCIRDFRDTLHTVSTANNLTNQEYLELVFGPKRLTYRVGSELARRIEQYHGYEALQKAVYLTGAEFYATYSGLLL
jgi:hypothetical protein